MIFDNKHYLFSTFVGQLPDYATPYKDLTLSYVILFYSISIEGITLGIPDIPFWYFVTVYSLR